MNEVTAGRSLHLVDPQLRDALSLYSETDLDTDSLKALRERVDAQFADAPPGPAEVARHPAPGIDGDPDISVLVYRPRGKASPLPCLYYIHGGGFVSGKAAMMAAQHHSLAMDLGCVVAAVEYRLAPETAYPGPLNDCLAGLAWLHGNAGLLGIDPSRIAICGNSAGGGLAAGLTLLTRDRNAFRPAFQYLLNPMLDDRTGRNGSPNPYAGEFVWTAASNRFGWRAMLGERFGSDDVPHYAAPSRAGSLEGLPPTYLCIGALDLFLEETLEYARRLISAGVPTELHVLPGAYHGSSVAGEAGMTKHAEHLGRDALRRALFSG